MSTMASQITSLAVVYSTVYSDADKRNIITPRHWPLCGDFTGTGKFPAQRASYAENVSIWWRHHEVFLKHHPVPVKHLSAWFHMYYRVPGARLTKAYDVTIQRYRNPHAKIKESEMHILRCLSSIFCVKFQRCPLKFHTKFQPIHHKICFLPLP